MDDQRRQSEVAADHDGPDLDETDGQRSETEPADYEDPIDEAAADSFPASDPPSFTDSTATRNPGRH